MTKSIYHIMPDSTIVSTLLFGEEYDRWMDTIFNIHGGYPVASFENYNKAVSHRHQLGPKWFGLDEFAPVSQGTGDIKTVLSLDGRLTVGEIVFQKESDFVTRDDDGIRMRIIKEHNAPQCQQDYWRYTAEYLTFESSYVEDYGWYSGRDSDGRPTYNHYSSAIDVIVERIGRLLTDEETCLLSLSTGFGPTPGMTREKAMDITNATLQWRIDNNFVAVPPAMIWKLIK